VAWSVLTRFELKQLEHDAIGVDYFSQTISDELKAEESKDESIREKFL
jgi:hypothetical protein